MNRNYIKSVTAIILAALLLASTLFLPQPAEATGRVIRVGYTDLDEVILKEDGTYSGYVADYLNEVAKYTGWQYEYVFDTWVNCQEMLKNGQLDLFGMVHNIEDRENDFQFSQMPMAHDYTILYAAADSDIYYQEYEAFDGCTVGMVEDTVHTISVSEYAQEIGINCQIKSYEVEKDALKALATGEIQLLATASTSVASDVKVVDRFGSTPSYFISGKGNQELMSELDEAMEQIRIEHIGLESNLAQQYLGISESSLHLTQEERAYIDSVGPIEVCVFHGRRPVSYLDGGRIVGVLPDYMDMLGEICGLEFVYVPPETATPQEEAALLEKNGTVLLSSSNLKGDGLYQSDPVFNLSLAYVRRLDNPDATREQGVFAVTRNMDFLSDLLLQNDRIVKYYDTAEQCMEAVYNGEADMTVQYEYVTSHLMHKPKYAANLMEWIGVDYAVNMSLYAPEGHALLVSILNKAINTLTEAQQVNVISGSMTAHSYVTQFDDLLYEYGWGILLVAAMVVILLLVLVLRSRMYRTKQQSQENEDLQRRLWQDEMTSVYNRAGFFANASNMIERLEGRVCIVRVNIFRFKQLNEMYGLENCDRLLREIGLSLKEWCDDVDMIVGRFAADHFYICVAEKDLPRLRLVRQITVPSLSMDVNMTYGIYPLEGQQDVPLNLMCDRAELANKSTGRLDEDYIRYYSDEKNQLLQREQQIESEMEWALEQEQFHIYIQPKYDVETEKIVGGEVLVRWFHPERGMIPPNEFIDLFERNGFIRRLDYYVWEQCCRFMAECKKAGLPVLPLSVNVSRIHFYGFESITLLFELVERYGLQPADLELEITESFCVENPDMLFEKCRQLRACGFKISMDDFGSGYSSLNMLKEMPVDIIKMDLRFLSGDNEEDQADKGRSILRTLIELAHNLELQVVVEGLETRSQKDFIRQIGGCAAQGYYFSRPMPAKDYAKLIQTEEIDERGLPAPPRKGNLRRERIMRELRAPFLEVIRDGANSCGYLIPEGRGILSGELATQLGIPVEVEQFPQYMLGKGHIAPESADVWKDLFAAVDRGELSASANVAIRLKNGEMENYWLRFDNVMDENGQAVMALITFDVFVEDQATAAENTQLKENQKILMVVAQHSDRVVCQYDVQNHTACVWNQEICQKCKLPRLCETTLELLLESDEIMPESVDTLRTMFQDIHNGSPEGNIKMRARDYNGTPRWYDMKYSTICDEHGTPVTALISHKDITEQYEHEMSYLRQLQSISESEQSLGIMEVDVTADVIEMQDSLFAPLHSSAVGQSFTGFAEHMVPLKMEEKDWDEGFRFFSTKYMIQQFEEGTRYMYRVWPMCLVSGKVGWARFDVELIADRYSGHIRAYFRIWDVTAIKEKQQEVQRRSERDAMTDLLNRATSEEWIRAKIDEKSSPGILLVLDLDQLKTINDSYGHPEGDKAINGIADALKTYFREGDIIGRVGGDEFVVYMAGAAQNKDAIAGHIAGLLRKLSVLAVGEHNEMRVSCSVGCAVEEAGSTYESLFKQADLALYRVKRSGRNNFAFYTPEMEEEGYRLQIDDMFSLQFAAKTESDDVRQLIQTLTSFYQLVLSVNVTNNDYYLMDEVTDGVFSKLPTFGKLDDFVQVTAGRIHPEDVEMFMNQLSRNALFAVNAKGHQRIQCAFRFLDGNKQYRVVEATVIFCSNPQGDLCDYTFVRWADELKSDD